VNSLLFGVLSNNPTKFPCSILQVVGENSKQQLVSKASYWLLEKTPNNNESPRHSTGCWRELQTTTIFYFLL